MGSGIRNSDTAPERGLVRKGIPFASIAPIAQNSRRLDGETKLRIVASGPNVVHVQNDAAVVLVPVVSPLPAVVATAIAHLKTGVAHL